MAKKRISMTEVEMEVYKKIAEWHNSDDPATVENVRQLSKDIVLYILEEGFSNFDTDIGIEMGKDAQKNMMNAFKEHQQNKGNKRGGIFSMFGGRRG